MKYFDVNNSFEDNNKQYKKLCKLLHPDMPTGNSGRFIEMKTEWDEYNKLISVSKKKADTDFYTKQPVKTNRKNSKAEVIFGSIIDLFIMTLKIKNKLKNK